MSCVLCTCALFLFVQKLEARKAALEKIAAPEEKKAKWRQLLCLAFMSSEESGEEEESGSSRPVLYVNRLPWRHPTVNKFLSQIDDKVEKNKPRRAKIQTLQRVPGRVSRRPVPAAEFGDRFWGFSDQFKK